LCYFGPAIITSSNFFDLFFKSPIVTFPPEKIINKNPNKIAPGALSKEFLTGVRKKCNEENRVIYVQIQATTKTPTPIILPTFINQIYYFLAVKSLMHFEDFAFTKCTQ